MQRAGREATRRARGRRRRFVRANAPRLGALVGVYLLLTSAVLVWGPPAGRTFLAGAFLVGLSALVLVVLVLDGAAEIREGAHAERRSSSALRRLVKTGWRVVDNVPYQSIDVDHVAVGPRGVVAIETKYTAQPWGVSDGDQEGPLVNPVVQAKLGARRIRLLLKGEGLDFAVAPALAIWGPGSTGLTTDAVDGVVLLVGRHAKQWRDQLPGTGQDLSAEQVEQVERVLKRVVAARSKNGRRSRRQGVSA